MRLGQRKRAGAGGAGYDERYGYDPVRCAVALFSVGAIVLPLLVFLLMLLARPDDCPAFALPVCGALVAQNGAVRLPFAFAALGLVSWQVYALYRARRAPALAQAVNFIGGLLVGMVWMGVVLVRISHNVP